MTFLFPFDIFHKYQDMSRRFRGSFPVHDNLPSNYLTCRTSAWCSNAFFEEIDVITQTAASHPEHLSTNLGLIYQSRFLDSSFRPYIKFECILEKDTNFTLRLKFYEMSKTFVEVELIRNSGLHPSCRENEEFNFLCGSNTTKEYLNFHGIKTKEDVINNLDKITIKSILDFYISSAGDKLFSVNGKMTKRDFSLVKIYYSALH